VLTADPPVVVPETNRSLTRRDTTGATARGS
jgi:hypothetical protein